MDERDFLRWRPDDDPGLSRAELESELGRVVTHGRRRRARRAAAIGSSLALLLVVGAAVAVQRPEGQPSGVTAADPGTTTTSNPAVNPDAPPVTPAPRVTTTTAVPQHPRPPFVVVARQATGTNEHGETYNSELAVLDAQTGNDIRVIRRTVFHISDVRLSPDRKHVYFVEGDCGFSALRVRVDGPADQEPDHLVTDAESEDPAVSADGRFLAYMGEGQCSEFAWELRVRDLSTEEERVVATEPRGYSIGSLSWSHDGATLAVSVAEVQEDKQVESFIALLDPTKEQDVLRAPRVSSSRAGFGFASPTCLPDGSMFVVEEPLGEKVGKAPALMLVVDGRTGETRRQVAVGDPKRQYRYTAADATGSHLLYISAPAADDGHELGDLRVSSNGGRTTVLARNVTAADW